MNIRLQKLFDQYNFSAKERYEFLQIFQLLDAKKQARVIDNFEVIQQSISKLQSDLAYEQEVLLGKTLDKIENRILFLEKKYLKLGVSQSIESLKKSL